MTIPTHSPSQGSVTDLILSNFSASDLLERMEAYFVANPLFDGKILPDQVTRTVWGETSEWWVIEFPEDKVNDRPRIHKFGKTKKEAEEILTKERALRCPLTQHLFSLPPNWISGISAIHKKVESLPPALRDSFNPGQVLQTALDYHLYTQKEISLRSLAEWYLKYREKRENEAEGQGNIPINGGYVIDDEANAPKTTKNGYRTTIKWAIGRLYNDEAERFPESRNVKTITTEEIEAFFYDLQFDLRLETIHTIYRVLSCIFNRAIKRKKLLNNPLNGIDLPSVELKKIIIHTVDETQALLNIAWDYDMEIIPLLFFGYYAAMSPVEVTETSWNRWSGEILSINKKITKRTRPIKERNVSLHNPDQVAWLAPFAGRTGLIKPFVGYAERFMCLREMVFRVYGIRIDRWRGSIRRRTHISHLYHSDEVSLDILKKRVGHHRDSDQVFLSYIGYVPKTKGKEYFLLMPPSHAPGQKQYPVNLAEDERKRFEAVRKAEKKLKDKELKKLQKREPDVL